MRETTWAGQQHPHPAIMSKRAPTLSPWNEGAEPSTMRATPPRVGEVLGSRPEAAPEHDHHDTERRPHQPHRRSPWNLKSSRKAAEHSCRGRGNRPSRRSTVDRDPEPPKAPTFCKPHPNPETPQATPPRRTQRAARRRRPIFDGFWTFVREKGRGWVEGTTTTPSRRRAALRGVAVAGPARPA